jgi:hypothetical protein
VLFSVLKLCMFGRKSTIHTFFWRHDLAVETFFLNFNRVPIRHYSHKIRTKIIYPKQYSCHMPFREWLSLSRWLYEPRWLAVSRCSVNKPAFRLNHTTSWVLVFFYENSLFRRPFPTVRQKTRRSNLEFFIGAKAKHESNQIPFARQPRISVVIVQL